MDAIALAVESGRILDTLIDEIENIEQMRLIGRLIAKQKDIRYILKTCKDQSVVEKNE